MHFVMRSPSLATTAGRVLILLRAAFLAKTPLRGEITHVSDRALMAFRSKYAGSEWGGDGYMRCHELAIKFVIRV
jgi:hypothetical protein